MPLDKPTLKEAIKQAQTVSSGASTPEEARELFAEALATAIDTFVKSGTVNTTGGPTAQTGAVT